MLVILLFDLSRNSSIEANDVTMSGRVLISADQVDVPVIGVCGSMFV